MGQVNRFAPFILLIVLFVVLQPLLIMVDGKKTPETTVKSFLKDYYYLDAAMEKWLCPDLAAGGEAVENFLYAKNTEARERGFEISFLRHMFTHMELTTIDREGDRARVHATGTTRVAINPVFMVIGRWFGLGQNHPVDITLDLVRQDGRWQVCGGVPGLDD